MISPAAKNPASWQAVDILRLDNQTANVSSCLAPLFNRHLLISFALSCLFAGLLARLLIVLPCLTATELKAILKKRAASRPLFFSLSPTFWNFYYLSSFFSQWCWY